MADASAENIDFPIDEESPSVPRLQTQIVQKYAKAATIATAVPKTSSSSNRRQRSLIAVITMLCLVSFLIGVVASPYINPGLKFMHDVAVKPIAAKLPNNANPAAPQPVAADDALELIRVYLKENTNSGTWDEIRWWPGFTVSTKLHRDALEETWLANQARDGDFLNESRELIFICTNDPTIRFARMKYRTNNHFGHPAVTDRIFVVQDHEVRTLTANQTLLVMLAWESLETAEAGAIKLPEVPKGKQ